MSVYMTVAVFLSLFMGFLYLTMPGRFRLGPLAVITTLCWLWPVLLGIGLLIGAIVIIPDWHRKTRLR